MPTKRVRVGREWQPQGLSVEERCWLTGEPLPPGGNKFWAHTRGQTKVQRCRALLVEYAELIPEGRLEKLQRDVEDWAGTSW
ncbi:MAG TPA: hypothetical protein VLD36_10870 [Burkholderiales bacterium]|nr:hypothetical protein [Burkholderiales bacterium]